MKENIHLIHLRVLESYTRVNLIGATQKSNFSPPPVLRIRNQRVSPSQVRMRASVARRCPSELVFEATPHGTSLLVFSLVSLPLSFLLPPTSSSTTTYLIQIRSAATRLRGERRPRDPHAADRRSESTQAPADEVDPAGVDSSPAPSPPERTGGNRYPVIALISTTREPRWPRGGGCRPSRI